MADDRDPSGAWRPERDAAADDLALVAAIAPALRAPERLAADFDARLMAAVRAESALYRPSRPTATARARDAWWRRPRALHVTPLAGLAYAAAFAGAVCLGTLGAAGLAGGLDPAAPAAATAALPAAPAASAAPDTVHLVRFVFVEPRARSVALVGDFNAWAREATPLAAAGPEGAWSVTVPLTPGRHEYAFIVDGERWVADPLVPVTTDDFGTESSIVTVGEPHARRT